jgi:hypothetical protein
MRRSSTTSSCRRCRFPFLRDLLRTDSIYINNNITVYNLQPVSSFLGKLGNPELGGLPLNEFKRRQELHRLGEIATMKDVPEFIDKARTIYGYQHFINDAGGSICELDDPEVIDILSEHTLILYIKASEKDEQALIRRAIRDPKPLYYREAFLDEQLAIYMEEQATALRRDDGPGRFRALGLSPRSCSIHGSRAMNRSPATTATPSPLMNWPG